jgi:hydroxymethylpyrimidine/phosphomethylpyrimidine kinase
MTRPHRERIPVALTIAGSDSGGGAGIQADLKTFASLRVHGASVITCVTAQNPKRVLGIEACSPGIVRRQVAAVFAELHPAAVKTGMLYSRQIIRAVAGCFKPGRRLPLVVDPVMVATSGARLLKPEAIRILENELLPRATLVTPNLPEAEVLVGRELKSPEDLRTAAKEIYRRFGCAALIKGGHLMDTRQAVDIFFNGTDEWLLSAPFIRGVNTHGTGCTYAAAITGYLARGRTLKEAVIQAKQYISRAIVRGQTAAGHFLLNHFAR